MPRPQPPQFDKRDAEGLAHSIRQFGFKAMAVQHKDDQWRIHVEANGQAYTLNNIHEYGHFKCDHILNSDLSEHNAAIRDILESDTTGPPDRF